MAEALTYAERGSLLERDIITSTVQAITEIAAIAKADQS